MTSAISSQEMAFASKFAKDLVDYSFESVQVEEDFHFLRFELLQRLNIVALENELAQIKSHIYAQDYITNPQELGELRKRLREYGKLDGNDTPMLTT